MHRYQLLVLLIACVLVCSGCANAADASEPIESRQPGDSSTPTPVGQRGDWRLILNEEFDGYALDDTLWTTCYWWGVGGCTIGSNNELEWYQPDDVILDDSIATLRAQERSVQSEAGELYNYTSGMISSGRDTSDTTGPARFSLQYGYVEIRAKVPRGQGLWPAFWLLPVDQSSKPEIDVMEILGHEPDTIQMHFHYRISESESESVGHSWKGPDFSADWHVYAVDWRPDALIWYVDGIERWRYTDVEHIPATPMYLIANLAVGGDWPGSPDASTPMPSFFEIDYVRAWEMDSEVEDGHPISANTRSR